MLNLVSVFDKQYEDVNNQESKGHKTPTSNLS